MSKDGERSYLEKIGEAGRVHSLGKPFSDPLCGINLVSIGLIMSLMRQPPAGVLDLGCGGGWTSQFLARRGYRVTGQDISEDMIALANENRALHGLSDAQLRFVCGDYEELGFEAAFDHAIFFDSLHHADDELGAIRSAYRALKPGGTLITHEPGEGHAANPISIEAMRLYGVNERDMPPSLIIRRGLEVGFSGFRVMPMPHELNEIFYGKPPPSLWSKKGLRFARRIVDLAFRPNMRAGAIVVLTK
ncbi:class I SAM-dependent methyltransferase [Sphingomonas fennica]|uniref:Methyltransferase type 11 domain-containing protein n=1 Tax=Edaphosphingomonas fennica TaxID=114404 RepID=A0A2T4I629_9SPHN|nr:class I SAM-dependent methyltransferase [Sphingomonas fennica]PTD26100.1 hypothetical protein CV103_03570 [Sphingomonas fennica]